LQWTNAAAKAGEWAVVTGAAGGVGHFVIQLLALSGLRIIAVDSGATKKALCEKLGTKAFIDYADVESVEGEVIKITGGKGAHAVFVAAGTARAYQSAPAMLRPGGKIVCLGHRKSYDIVKRKLLIFLSQLLLVIRHRWILISSS
jgi:propanol-preferring alcohol dehydrogenase